MRTVPVRLPAEMARELRVIAGLKCKTPGEVMAEAWALWLHKHAGEIAERCNAILDELPADARREERP